MTPFFIAPAGARLDDKTPGSEQIARMDVVETSITNLSAG